MLTDPDLVVAEVVQQLDELEIPVQGERRVDADLVDRREERAEAQRRGEGLATAVMAPVLALKGARSADTSDVAVWTDDFSDILSALWRSLMGKN